MNWLAVGDVATWVSAAVALGVAVDTRIRVDRERRERLDARLWLATETDGALRGLDYWAVHLRYQADSRHTRFRAEVEGVRGLRLSSAIEGRNDLNEVRLEPPPFTPSAKRLSLDMSITGGVQATQFLVWPGRLSPVRVQVSIVDNANNKRLIRRVFDLA
jgi:hypothetical protein